MSSLVTKRKMFIIATCIFMVTMSTILFLVGEDKLNIEPKHISAHVLQDDEILTVQDESFYRDLIGNHEDDIFILKTDTIIHFSTENWREEFGYQKDEVNGKNFFSFIHPKDLPSFANTMIELMKTEKEMTNIGPFRIKDSLGKYMLYMAELIPLKNSEDEIVEIALALRDLSITL